MEDSTASYSQIPTETIIRIKIRRRNALWRMLKKLSLIFAMILLIFATGEVLFLWHSYDSLSFAPVIRLIHNINLFVAHHPYLYAFVALMGFSALSILFRPRYLVIDRAKGFIYYSLPVFGRTWHYFVEVAGVQMEADMSDVLTHLESQKLYRVYLALHSGKYLLIHEDWKEQKAQKMAEKLKAIFQVSVSVMHRVGTRRMTEMTLGSYVVEKELSHGGMGKVFLGRDKNTGEKVAIKVLPASFAFEKSRVSNFSGEIKILQKLSHPGIVKIQNVGRENGSYGDVYFYAMEFIEGQPLTNLIENKMLSTEESAWIALQVALALDYSHKHGVIHRDIKPSNIMVRPNRQVVLIDFGIAKDLSNVCQKEKKDSDSSHKEISHYIGTLPYMSPEQISPGSPIDYHTDIYSLGVTLYEMLTGQRPFRGGEQSICKGITNYHPPDPSAINSLVPKELDIITMKAMEKDRKRRYQSGTEFAEDVYRWLRGKPILSQPIGRWKRAWRRFRSWFMWI